jgi:hypothetical protein
VYVYRSMELTKTTKIYLDMSQLGCLLLGEADEILSEDGVDEEPRHDRLDEVDLGSGRKNLVRGNQT